MTALVCDTSGLLAALDTADPDHKRTRAALEAHDGPLLLPTLELAELDYLLRRRLGAEAVWALAEDVAGGAYELVGLSAADVEACVALDGGYADLGIGLTDASLVVAAHHACTRSLLTLDERHFRAVRPLEGGVFRLLPADAA